MSCYLDTSALAKWYLPEAGSQDFEQFVQNAASLVISRLVTLELRCLLARRQRAEQIDRRTADDAYQLFLGDVAKGYVTVVPVPDERYAEALAIIQRVEPVAPRTLDALHLAAAEAAGCARIATADHVMNEAGQILGFEVLLFG